jgi:hypothetical protein
VQLGYYSRAQGCADGAAAYLMAQSVIAQPSGSVIYFAVPDAAALDGAAVRYFEGVNQAFARLRRASASTRLACTVRPPSARACWRADWPRELAGR